MRGKARKHAPIAPGRIGPHHGRTVPDGTTRIRYIARVTMQRRSKSAKAPKEAAHRRLIPFVRSGATHICKGNAVQNRSGGQRHNLHARTIKCGKRLDNLKTIKFNYTVNCRQPIDFRLQLLETAVSWATNAQRCDRLFVLPANAICMILRVTDLLNGAITKTITFKQSVSCYIVFANNRKRPRFKHVT